MMSKPLRPIYFDYASTTPVDPRVAHKMSDCLMLDGQFGNPASTSHRYGWEASELVEEARENVAKLIGASPLEIVWTSGATESDNLAIKGLAHTSKKKHIVTSSYEHKAVLDTCQFLETQGFQVTYVKPDSAGLVPPASVEAAINDNTFLVSVMHVNNEIGTQNDIKTIGELCAEKGVSFHVDAAQSVGKVPVNVANCHIDLLSLSGHKIYGPKGIGALYVRRDSNLKLEASIHGGGHERGMRSGTLPTHQIVGLGAAAWYCLRELPQESERINRLKRRLIERLCTIDNVQINGSETASVPGIVNFSFTGVDGESLLNALDDIAISSGSACTSAAVEPSYVLREIGVPYALAEASLRFSMGRYTTEQDVDYVSERVNEVVRHLRF